jgi:Trk K+ transport system NAD-binding subunit
MKVITTLVSAHLAPAQRRSNLRVLAGLLVILVAIVTLFSVLFHVLMAREGQEHSWLTGFYWTIVAMSTLGFGDITFTTDLGRMFSVFVVVTGTMLMLIILPFTFIQFFYAPWLEARDAARAPRELPDAIRGHVLLTGHGPVERTLAQRLRQFRIPYAILVADVREALALDAEGLPVMVGETDDPETYTRARVDHAALVVAAQSDPVNANIVATVRERSAEVSIAALASSPASVDILQLAGSNKVVELVDLLGQSMARRVAGRDGRSHVIGQIDQLFIAEAAAAGTPLVGQTLKDTGLRTRFNLNVAGVWARGRFTLARADTLVTPSTVLLLAGTETQLAAYDEAFAIPGAAPTSAVIIGGGRVGRCVAQALAARGVEYRLVEKIPGRSPDPRTIVGDAANIDVLNEAGIRTVDTVLVTTHDDAVNIYLALYCRRLRPDLLILSRATLERNATTLHRAGADYVFSSASMGANAIFNMLRDSRMLFVAEGLDVFTTPIPPSLVGRTLSDLRLRENTGANVLAVRLGGEVKSQIDPALPLPEGGELVLIGDREAEEKFFGKYGKK